VPVHLAFLCWQRVQALLTWRGLLPLDAFLVLSANLVLRPRRFDLASSSSSQVQSRPSLVQPPQGRWPEHLDFLPRHRRQAIFALGWSTCDILLTVSVTCDCLGLGAHIALKAGCVSDVCVVVGAAGGNSSAGNVSLPGDTPGTNASNTLPSM
jgi:hypothetical protein